MQMFSTKSFTVEKGYNRWKSTVNRFFYGKSPKERFLILLTLVMHFFIAAVFSGCRLPYTDMSVGVPLTDALLCSSGAGMLGAYAGAIYGAFLTKTVSFSRFFVLTAVAVLRIAVSVWIGDGKEGARLFKEPPLIKVGYASFMALTESAFHLTESGVYEGVWIKLLATVIALPVLTTVFAVFFSGCPRKRIGEGGYAERMIYELTVLAFFFAVVYSLKDIRYFGVSLASVATLILTLISASKGGAVRGAVIGAVLGAVCSPALAVSYATVGGVAGIFYCIGVLPTAGISAFAGVSVALFQVGYGALVGFVPETVIAVAAVSPMIRYSFIPERFPYPKNELPREYDALSEAETRAMRNIERNENIERLSEALRDISKTLNEADGCELYQRSKKVSNALSSGFCESCALSSICWESEAKRAEESVKGIMDAYERGEALPRDKKTNYLSGYCIKFKELSEEIRRVSNEPKTETATASLNSVAACNFKSVADMLSDVANNLRLENARDVDAEKTVLSVSGAIGFKPDTVSVLGSERKRIYAHGVRRSFTDEEREKIRKAFSEACKTEYALPVIMGEKKECMVFSPEKTLSAKVCCLKSTKAGEVCSGDNVLSGEMDDGYFYAMLADGMGSGEEANNVSKTALSVLEKLLRCRVKKSTAALLAGDILKRRNGECFTTLDIMELDLVSGNASFLKNGAAASYIVRNGGVYCINANSMPVGITEEAYPVETGFRLSAGDTVIMLSDGIASDGFDGKWISDTVSGSFNSPEELTELIMKKSGELCPQNDDKTVLVIEIGRFKQETAAKEA